VPRINCPRLYSHISQTRIHVSICHPIPAVLLLPPGSVFSLKRFSKARVAARQRQAQVLRERSLVLSLAPSVFIPGLLCRTSDARSVGMVLQARLAGPLAAVIPDDGVSETTAQFYAAGVVLALEQLHRDGVLYRGVCLDTLLLDCQGQLQVSCV
jgi:serine/threonine protein kinase